MGVMGLVGVHEAIVGSLQRGGVGVVGGESGLQATSGSLETPNGCVGVVHVIHRECG